MYKYEKKNLQTLRQSLAECTVLLKSNDGFPLAETGKLQPIAAVSEKLSKAVPVPVKSTPASSSI